MLGQEENRGLHHQELATTNDFDERDPPRVHRRARGIKVTRDNYLALDYGHVPEKLPAELKAQLPQSLQLREDTNRQMAHALGYAW